MAGSDQVKPDPVAQLDTVDDDAAGVARRRRESVAFDRAEPEPAPLVEAQVVDVGGGRRDEQRGHRSTREKLDQ
ncbi:MULTISPECIES: hypothetical protein [unclassified Frankia]|uniref:hypothetical protein n=1 Tax=unclassified Frankia TaxID=2632575 RepID=UPI00055A115B|nr:MULTISPECIES: hypothetical protein [unclassified Frankia]